MKKLFIIHILLAMPLLAWCDNINFADAEVKTICVKNWDTNGDGELSYEEAAAVTSLGKAFWENTVITSFDEFHNFIGLYQIESEAFQGCSSLSSISIPNSVKSILYEAFDGCISLTKITIPNSVTNINAYAFHGCSSRKIIKVESGNLYYDSREDCNAIIETSSNTLILGSEITVIPNSVKSIGQEAFGYCNSLKNITIPNSVTSIGSGAFTRCSSLDSITIPNSVNDLGYYAFSYCTSLKSITLPNSLKSIEQSMFSDCTSLKSITLPNSVISIGLFAFHSCSSLRSITIPNSLKSIDSLAFLYCNLDSIFISDLTAWCKIDYGGFGDYHLYLNGKEIEDLVIPDGINTISSIFSGCISVKTITMPSSVTSIGNNAFSWCSSLTSVSIGPSVTSIGNYAFSGCSSLTSINIPSAVTSIGESAFNRSGLTSIIYDADIVMPDNIITSAPNLLFYTKDASYAPSNIRNVIVNGTAKKIVLSDASSGNNFYCPREFTAEKISYTHNYRMTSGLDGQARGWETIALPFTVSEITHESKGKLLPFGAWTSSSDAKPFWLCKLSSSGFTRATTIEANTPYIICMPNNSDYDSSFNLSGNVTFTATNVKVPVSSSVSTAKSNGKTFIPAFCAQEKASGVYALNVNNSYHSENGGYTEGSAFVSDLRAVSPFEAYMTTDANNAKRAFLIEFSETTGVDEMPTADDKDGLHKVFNLNGQLVKKANSQNELDETLKQLPTGVYIINGKKTVIKR